VTAPRNPLVALPPVVGEPGLNLALSRIGLPAAPATQGDLVLRRREWLLGVMEAQRALSAKARAIPRVRGLSPEDFLDHHYAPGRPVVIERAIDHWPALKRWTPDYLRRKIGDAPVEFQGGRNANPDFEIDGYSHKQNLPFGAYLDRIAAGGNDAYITANNSAANRAALAPLERDLGTIDSYLTRAHGMIWIGPAGTFTPLHFDLTNNLIAQIIGRKRVILLPPSESARLHHGRHVFSAVRDLEDEERLALYPSAREATRFVVDLGPGDLLYSPIGWWHQVRALEFSVTITYTNFHWPNQGFESFPRD
jgi:hypothetical protein